MADANSITTLSDLEALYGPVGQGSIAKEVSRLTPEYRKWIEASPFLVIASSGSGGLDCSPRGDASGQLHQILDDTTLAIADRRGNNRIDTLRNIITDPRVALLFFIPGIRETLRIVGQATITTDPELVDRFAVGNTKPVTVLVVSIDSVYFQCGRALIRSGIWDGSRFVDQGSVPTAGEMIKGALPNFDADAYDKELPARQKSTLY